MRQYNINILSDSIIHHYRCQVKIQPQISAIFGQIRRIDCDVNSPFVYNAQSRASSIRSCGSNNRITAYCGICSHRFHKYDHNSAAAKSSLLENLFPNDSIITLLRTLID